MGGASGIKNCSRLDARGSDCWTHPNLQCMPAAAGTCGCRHPDPRVRNTGRAACSAARRGARACAHPLPQRLVDGHDSDRLRLHAHIPVRAPRRTRARLPAPSAFDLAGRSDPPSAASRTQRQLRAAPVRPQSQAPGFFFCASSLKVLRRLRILPGWLGSGAGAGRARGRARA